MGIAKTVACIKKCFIWYGLWQHLQQEQKGDCEAKSTFRTISCRVAIGRVHIDILGPFTPSTRGNQYVLMIVDQFTKWLECYLLPLQNEEVAKCMVDGFISRFGCPIEIHTDQGKNFDGKLFASVCELLQIAKTKTTPYRPCSNGQVERYNRTVLQLIRCFLKRNQQNWDEPL